MFGREWGAARGAWQLRGPIAARAIAVLETLARRLVGLATPGPWLMLLIGYNLVRRIASHDYRVGPFDLESAFGQKLLVITDSAYRAPRADARRNSRLILPRRDLRP